ncbi:RNA-binding protein [Methanococcus voltae]|uniref:ribosome assembly RNA-binding protein YhbY n=1 Tax=Methanococcus voltae TaxID=2188 RepID=UPI001AE63F29|nr:ribosome assembly RNA-binding protein YhbY [Methanococcus voltae]MBP2143792.1 RNA-binding protein [Methanococcus voltae]
MDSKENNKVITSKAKKILRSQSQAIEPVVWVGKEGVEKVIEEVRRQLKDKSLIKVKIRKSAIEGMEKDEIAKIITDSTDSEVVSIVGNVVTLFKPKEGWKKYTTCKPKTAKTGDKYIEEFESLRSRKHLMDR